MSLRYSFTSATAHLYLLFFFNDTATTEIYTLSLHDALPISLDVDPGQRYELAFRAVNPGIWMDHCHNLRHASEGDRKSTRLNSSHITISYAVFCLKKKTNTESKIIQQTTQTNTKLQTPAPVR